MSFLNPLALALLAVVPVVIALYLIRNRRRRFVAPTLMFWQRAAAEHETRRFLGRIRNPLSLLLQLLIVALLLLAASQVEWTALSLDRPTLIVLDQRLRMNSGSPGDSAFSRAADAARRLASTAREGAPAALLSAGRQPRVLAPLSEDRRQLEATLAAAEPTEEAGALSDAIRSATRIATALDHPTQLLVLTDREIEAPEGLPDATTFRSIATGTPAANAAITAFGLERAPGDPGSATGYLQLANFSDKPAELLVSIRSPEALLDTVAAQVPAGATEDLAFSLSLPAGETLVPIVAELEPADALKEDNRAFAVLPPVLPIRVLLVSEGDRFLEEYLRAEDFAAYELLSPASWNPAFAASFDVVIFDRVANLDPGDAPGVLYLGTAPFASDGDSLEAPVVTETRSNHPAVRGIDLEAMRVIRALPFPEQGETPGYETVEVIRSGERPLAVAGESADGRRFFATAFATLESDLPLRAAFPLLMRSVLFWLAGRDLEPPRDLPAGSVVALPSGERIEEIAFDSGERTEIASGPATVRLSRSGIFARNGEREELFAVNGFSAEESNLQAASGNGGWNGVGLHLPSLAAGSLWRWLALAAFLLLVLEWLLFHARRTE